MTSTWLIVLVVICTKRALSGQVETPWWSNAVYYRILVDSFKDADGDGLGDINGLIKQLSYIKAIGADAAILSSIVQRSVDCSKPGTVDHIQIDARYGSLSSFSAMIDKAKKIDLKVIITIPMKTVSELSEWFGSSTKSINGFDDWIIWREGNPEEPPQSVEGVESWLWNEERKAFWASLDKEPLLNLCSEGVNAALSAIQCAWLRRGVSGILLNPDFVKDLDCGEKLLRKLMIDATSCIRSANLDAPVFLIESSLSYDEAAKYYNVGNSGVSVIAKVLNDHSNHRAAEVALGFYEVLLKTPQNMAPSWITSTSGDSRIATKHGNQMVDAINLLAMVLPGAIIIQQGDELGAADTLLEWVSSTNTCWPLTGVPSAAPFPWDDTGTASFSTGVPWLPLAPNYRYANAKSEFTNDFSHLGAVKIAAAMRKSPAMGPHTDIKRLEKAVAVLRWGNTGSLLVISNVDRDSAEIDLSNIPGLPAQMTVAVSSAGSSVSTGTHVNTDKSMKLAQGETVMLAGAPRHCGGPGPVDKIASKLSEGWQKINKYFNT